MDHEGDSRCDFFVGEWKLLFRAEAVEAPDVASCGAHAGSNLSINTFQRLEYTKRSEYLLVLISFYSTIPQTLGS